MSGLSCGSLGRWIKEEEDGKQDKLEKIRDERRGLVEEEKCKEKNGEGERKKHILNTTDHLRIG